MHTVAPPSSSRGSRATRISINPAGMSSCVARLAFGASAALSMVAANAPDLIVLDVLMPGMDGIECLEIMRSQDRIKDVPVILVTADQSERVDEAAFTFEDCFVMRKPVRYESVVKTAQLILARETVSR